MSVDMVRKKFFDELDRQLKEKGDVFTYSLRQHYAIINRPTPNFGVPCLSLELLLKHECIRIGLFIMNDEKLYNKLYERREEFEERLGFKCSWESGVKNENSKRVCVLLPFDGDNSDYSQYVARSIPIVQNFISVFHDYIDC